MHLGETCDYKSYASCNQDKGNNNPKFEKPPNPNGKKMPPKGGTVTYKIQDKVQQTFDS